MPKKSTIRILSFILLVVMISTLAPALIVSAASSVLLRDGDARKLSDPPNVIAYANANQYSSPPEFAITTGGTIWRYYQWIALQGNGSWVNANITVLTNNAGIQFWGDNNDGWARVLVDGIEVWKGNTYGADGSYPGNAFAKYLEISGLTSGTHNIKVENLGINGAGGGSDVTIYFFGLKKATASSPTVAPSGLIAYYPFDGDTRDKSGNGYDGTNYGATFVPGANGQALSFDGKDDYVSAQLNINPDVLPRMTITLWAKADKEYGTVISHDNGGFDRTIDIDDRGGGLGWSCFSGSGGVLGYRKVDIGQWAFVAAVYDQTANKVRLHVNDAVFEESGTLYSGWNYINIARNPSFGGYFTGMIDELRIYNYALSATEIASLRAGVVAPAATIPAPTAPPTSAREPIAYYPFDNDYQDHSGNGNHGTLKGSIPFVPAAVGNGARFDGKSWLEVNDSSSLDLYNAYTFSVWVYKENAGVGGWSVILEKADTSAMDNRSPYGFAHTQDGYTPIVNFAYDNRLTTISSNIRTNFKEWNFLTVTWDGTNVRFYLNGILRDTKTWSNPLPSSTSKLLIGCGPVGATEYFVGILDELRIYNRAISQEEINGFYQQGKPGTLPTTTATPTLPPAPSPCPPSG